MSLSAIASCHLPQRHQTTATTAKKCYKYDLIGKRTKLLVLDCRRSPIQPDLRRHYSPLFLHYRFCFYLRSSALFGAVVWYTYTCTRTRRHSYMHIRSACLHRVPLVSHNVFELHGAKCMKALTDLVLETERKNNIYLALFLLRLLLLFAVLFSVAHLILSNRASRCNQLVISIFPSPAHAKNWRL